MLNLSTGRCRIVGAIAIAALLVALAFSARAQAGSFEWLGSVGVGLGNGQCYWYSGQSACSGWAYWNQLNATNRDGDEVHAGFQNTSKIRGGYLFDGQADIFYPGDYGMGGYLKSGVTWCSWNNCHPSAYVTYIWFKSWN